MQDAVAQLACDGIRDIVGTLGDKVHAHSLGTDQADHLLDLVDQRLRGILEEHVGLVEEENQLRQL